MKKNISIFLIVLLLFTFTGCSEQNYKLSKPERITLLRIVPDAARYEVFVITPDYIVKQYDFTSYWLENSFDYCSDPLPPESEYTLNEWRITESSWNSIIEVMEQNRFSGLPEEIEPVEGYDFADYYIEVEADGIIHKTGGYGAGENKDKKSRRFKNVRDEIFEHLEAEKPAKITSGKIVDFYFICPAGESSHYYAIAVREDGLVLNGQGPESYFDAVAIDEKILRDLQEIIIEHDIINWDGFYGTVPDNEYTSANRAFGLSIIYDDSTVIAAHGDHAFPEGYEDAEKAILKFFDDLAQNKRDE